MKRPVVCCEHNLCPDRPTSRLKRFINRPWYDPQCGRMWLTRWTETYYSMGQYLEWYEVLETTKAVAK